MNCNQVHKKKTSISSNLLMKANTFTELDSENKTKKIFNVRKKTLTITNIITQMNHYIPLLKKSLTMRIA